VPGSVVRYNSDHGALLCEASTAQFSCRFIALSQGTIDTYTINAAVTPTPTATPQPTPSPTPSATHWLVGHVTWQGRPPQPDPANQLPITLTLQTGTMRVTYTNRITDASGYFSVPVDNVPTGSYNWWAKGPNWLATSGTLRLTGLTITTQELGLQPAGDANNDNVVDVADFSLLRATFGKTCGDPDYDGRTDFTGDCLVDVADFSPLRGNFGQTGPPAP